MYWQFLEFCHYLKAEQRNTGLVQERWERERKKAKRGPSNVTFEKIRPMSKYKAAKTRTIGQDVILFCEKDKTRTMKWGKKSKSYNDIDSCRRIGCSIQAKLRLVLYTEAHSDSWYTLTESNHTSESEYTSFALEARHKNTHNLSEDRKKSCSGINTNQQWKKKRTVKLQSNDDLGNFNHFLSTSNEFERRSLFFVC